MPRVLGVIAMLALALPFVTWVRYGEQLTVWDSGFIGPPLWGLTILGILLVAIALVWPWNRLIGGFCCYAAVTALWSKPYAISVAIWITLGGVLASQLSFVGTRTLRSVLVTLGLIQVAILVYQFFDGRLRLGEWDLPYPHGTYGNPRYLAMVLAIIAPMAPLVLIPVFAIGLFVTKSYIAIFAAAIALGVRYRTRWPVTVPAALGALAVAYWLRGPSTDTFGSRLFIERATLLDWWQGGLGVHAVGYGLGAWLQRVYTTDFHGELYLAPYNDYLQVLHEMGLVGVGFLVAFFVVHRRWFRDEPALISVAVLAVVWFPFHLAAVAVVALAVLGKASCQTPEVGSTSWSGARSYSRLWWEAAV